MTWPLNASIKDDDVPVCPICQTETIVAMHGQYRCVDCHRLWDGSERGQTDTFFPPTILPDERTQTLIDILDIMWNRGDIEPHVRSQHGNQKRTGSF